MTDEKKPVEVEPEVVDLDNEPVGNYVYTSFYAAPAMHKKVASWASGNYSIPVIAKECQISERIVAKILEHPPIKLFVTDVKEAAAIQENRYLKRFTDLIEVAIDNVSKALISTDEERLDRATRDYLDRYPTGAFSKRRHLDQGADPNKMDGPAISSMKHRYKQLTGATKDAETTDTPAANHRPDDGHNGTGSTDVADASGSD